MLILSHRGYWKDRKDTNTLKAFKRSFDSGFGTELDVRDDRGRLAVSHDVPDRGALDLERVLKLYAAYQGRLYLAINVKADGLQKPLCALLKKYGVSRYFVFDMSVPDALGYLKAGMKVFTRQSEFEKEPAVYARSRGVWMDEFRRHWITAAEIRKHLRRGKQVCLVSPELHQRRHRAVWREYRGLVKQADTDKFMICTDFPEEARRFFYG